MPPTFYPQSEAFMSVTPPTAANAAYTRADALDSRIAALHTGGISLLETLEIALRSLTVNKLRTLLTALGIIIGVAAVVALMAIGTGSQASITASITANGANLLTVRSGASNTGGVRGAVGGAQTLTTKDAAALADMANAPSVSLVSPEYSSNGQLVAASQNINASIVGAEPAYMTVHNITLAEGDFISQSDISNMATVVVLGANVASTLFPDGDAVGLSLRINGQKFTVAGVLVAKGGSGFGSSDDGVLVPLSTAQRKLFGGRAVKGGAALLSSIAVQAKDSDSVTIALDEITATLRERHNLATDGSADDFSVINQQDILATATQTTQVQLDANSALRKQSNAQISDITNGEQIVVTGTVSGTTIQATNVQIGGAGGGFGSAGAAPTPAQ
jgi:putative ABC transport system permease protein